MRKNIPILLVTLILLPLAACETPGPQFRDVRSFSDGLAPVQIDSGQWGYINEHQQWVIEPQFEDAREFQAGKAAVRQDGKWGFINRKGEWL